MRYYVDGGRMMSKRDSEYEYIRVVAGLDLKMFRLQAGMKQSDLAKALQEASDMKIDNTTISKWERGSQTPSPQAMFALAKVLNIPKEKLFRTEDYEFTAYKPKADDENGKRYKPLVISSQERHVIRILRALHKEHREILIKQIFAWDLLDERARSQRF
jgi:transcriptional regulator with XRE-family HTH domain